MNEMQREIYSNLGYLTIQFAKMEYQLQTILTKYLESEADLLSIYVIEKNNLEQNTQLMAKFDEVRDRHTDIVQDMLKRIREVKKKRNLFVHGIWDEPHIHEGNPRIACHEMKLDFSIIKSEAGITKAWKGSSVYLFTLMDIQSLIEEINSILDLEIGLMEKLKKEPLDY